MASNETLEKEYRHVVSLGGSCKVAGLLQNYGLRDASYPFDWNVGSPEAVLLLIDNGFEGFLQPEALVVVDGVVCDSGSGVCMPNDFDPSRPLEDQSAAVRAKYSRRIKHLMAAATEPTLFVRGALRDDELDWLLSHPDEALEILRRGHPDNGLVVVTADGPVPEAAALPVYRIGDKDLRRRLLRLSYPLPTRLRNLVRNLGPGFLKDVRAKVALRTRARRLACRLHLRPSAARSS